MLTLYKRLIFSNSHYIGGLSDVFLTMCVSALILSLSLWLVILVEAETSENYNGNRNFLKPHILLNKKINWSNGTYTETLENFVRLPIIKQTDVIKLRQKLKKSPKRTIQKIIKNNRLKSRKMYLNQATRQTTQSSNKEYDFYAQEDNQRQEEMTTQGNQKKRIKKYNAYPRNPPSLFSHWNNHKRNRRDLDKDNILILTDFDEMKFLGQGKDYDVVNTHLKDSW